MKIRHTRHGFTLVELLVVIGIAGIVSGLAIMSFIGVSRSMRLTSGGEALNQSLLNARQQAITSRSARRVAINLVNGEFWTERKNVEERDFDTSSGKNVILSTEVKSLPKTVIVADIGGYTTSEIQSNNKVWYFEFDSRGTAITYPSGGLNPASNPNVHSRAFTRLDNMAIHLITETTLFQLVEDGPKRTYDLNSSDFVNFIGRISAIDRNNDGIDDNAPGVDAMVAADTRRQVVTVFFLTLTGRSQVFDYGYGTPWSELDVQIR